MIFVEIDVILYFIYYFIVCKMRFSGVWEVLDINGIRVKGMVNFEEGLILGIILVLFFIVFIIRVGSG